MQKLITSFFIISLFLSLYACHNKKNNNAAAEQLQIESETVVTEGIVMNGYPAVLNILTDTIKVTISNNTELEATTGTYYEIEQYVNHPDITGWQRVPLELFFHDIAFILKPGGAKEFSILLHPEMYKYESGKYRVTKKVTTEKGKYELFFAFELKL